MILKMLTAIALLFCQFCADLSAQSASVNLNPDKNGEHWYLDNYTEPAAADITYMTELEKEEILNRLAKNQLPSKVDNSFSIYSRPVFSQIGGSCGSASRICYMFAHEINSYRRVNGSLPENIYPSHFTWLLTGQNSGKETMAKENGIPNSIDYGGKITSAIFGSSDAEYGWMTGYERWRNAMSNKIERTSVLPLNTPQNLQILKSWLYNHHGDSSFAVGGMTGAGCAITNANIVKITNSYEQNRYIVKKWGPQVDHGTTWSGYDDSVAFDLNGDGRITNDQDITGDSIVDMADWEKGALIMLNSWGAGWGNRGTVYVPYSLCKSFGHSSEFYYTRKDYQPKRYMKIRMDYSKRVQIKLSTGIATNINATVPEKTRVAHHFINAGKSEIPMLGKWANGVMHTEPMEFCLDLTDLAFGYDQQQALKYFLKIETTASANGTGKIYEMSVVDLIDGQNSFEYFSADSNMSILDSGKTTYATALVNGNPASNDPFIRIPYTAMQIKSYDSQESSSPATNAIDGNPLTNWHTAYTTSQPGLPHEIQINIGSMESVTAFSYLPRQTGNTNGNIKEYEFYVSENGENWGTPVAQGFWPNTRDEKFISFPAKTGRFVKLKALQEANGQKWTSAAEISVFKSTAAPSGIHTEDPVKVTKLAINDNYPNPFNPETTIRYFISKNTDVSIKIFNTFGQQIEELVNGRQIAGAHSVVFNGANLSSGIYYCVIKAANQSVSKKMMLLK